MIVDRVHVGMKISQLELLDMENVAEKYSEKNLSGCIEAIYIISDPHTPEKVCRRGVSVTQNAIICAECVDGEYNLSTRPCEPTKERLIKAF